MVAILCTVLQGTVNISDICSKLPVRNQPRIAAIVDDLVTEYLLFVNKKFLQFPSLKMVLFIVFSCYYCFNLEYPGAAKWIFFFFSRLHFRAT